MPVKYIFSSSSILSRVGWCRLTRPRMPEIWRCSCQRAGLSHTNIQNTTNTCTYSQNILDTAFDQDTTPRFFLWHLLTVWHCSLCTPLPRSLLQSLHNVTGEATWGRATLVKLTVSRSVFIQIEWNFHQMIGIPRYFKIHGPWTKLSLMDRIESHEQNWNLRTKLCFMDQIVPHIPSLVSWTKVEPKNQVKIH